MASTSSRRILEKVESVLAINLSDPQSISTLETLSALNITPSEGTQFSSLDTSSHATSTDIRKEIDLELVKNGDEYLSFLKSLDQTVNELQGHLQSMKLTCGQVQDEVKSANEACRPVLEQSREIENQWSEIEVRQSIVSLFLQRFTLNDQEIALLTSRDLNSVGQDLFNAMDKCERIRMDCRSLLAATSSTNGVNDTTVASEDPETLYSSSAGIDIMEATSQHLEEGYQLLHKYCAFVVRGYTKDNLEVTKLMKEAVKCLFKRRDLLDQVVDLLASCRSNATLTLFIEALTRGGPSGLPRPIELHAHDPMRYIGDMLAWVHQAMASEREFLESLFSLKSDDRRIGSTRDFSQQDDSQKLVRHLLDKNLEGCGRPLKLRVIQTIKSQEGTLIVYKISHLIRFYQITMHRTLGSNSYLCRVHDELVKFVDETFEAGLASFGRSLLRYIQPPAKDLSAPDLLQEALDNLRDIIQVYDTSLTEDEERENEFKSTLNACLNPALEMCTRMRDMVNESWDQDIFMLNCLLVILNVLKNVSFTKTRTQEIEKKQEESIQRLIEEHYEGLLKSSGLEPVMKAIEEKNDQPLSRMPHADSKELTSALHTFSEFLSTIDTLTSERLILIGSSLISNRIHQKALNRITDAYKLIYEQVSDPSNKYEFAQTILVRGVDEVQVLLGGNPDQ